ncbi:MAG: amidohydrolase [Gammaproteobacteria bacterium]|nr:amidohydrolase [Gammaproteobacteria bacterium]
MAVGHADAKVIDLHAHVVLEDAFGLAGPHGPELARTEDGVPYFRIGSYRMQPMDYRGTIFMDVEKRLERMREAGIDLQLLSPNPLTMFHRIEAEHAIRFCRAHNDAMAELVARHPDHLLGGIALPMQDVPAAIAELDRSVKQLGLVAACTGTDYPVTLDAPELDDFYAALVDLDVPLFLHPASTGGAGGPDDARLGRFDFTLLLGYAYEETLATATLIFGGVLDRHPRLDVCVSHGGGAMPFLIERFEGMSRFRAWAPESVKEHGFAGMLKRLWFDAHVDGAAAVEMLVETVGRERLVYGTNFGGWDAPKQADALAAELTPNARRLMRLDRSA